METGDEDAVFDEVIKSIGDDGKFQKRFNWLFNFVLVVSASLTYWNIIISMGVPDHWCHIPGRENTNFTIQEWKEIHLPKETDPRGKLSHSKCKFYNDTSFWNKSDESNILECNQGWEFDRTWYGNTPPSQESWVCDKDIYVTKTFTFNRLGELLGTFIFGHLADAVGRKPAFFLSVITIVIGNIMEALTASIPVLFYIAVLLASLPSTSVFLGPLIIAMEISNPEKRAHISMMQCLGWTLGLCILPLVFWVVRDWVYFMLLTTLPLILFIFSKNLIIESPRWLSSKRKVTECVKELEKIAKVNKKKLPPNVNALLTKKEVNKEQVYGVLALFSSWRLAKNTLMLVIGWSIVACIYFIVTLNVNNLGGNPFMNYFWQGLVELPAYVVGKFSCDRFGRRLSNIISFILATIGCIPLIFIIQDESQTLLVSIISIYLKFAICIAYFVLHVQSMETYPTCIRQTGISLGAIAGCSIGIFVPYIIYLGTTINATIPYVIASILSAIGLITGICLPETLHHKLPESLAEAAVFGADQDIWGNPRKVKNLEDFERPLKKETI